MWVVVTVVFGVVSAATYVTLIASRLDRLSSRLAGAYSTLDAQSIRRAAATLSLEDKAVGIAAARAAARAVIATSLDERLEVENDLTRTLRTVVRCSDTDATRAVVDASRGLALARQVYNGLVQDAHRTRRGWLTRAFRAMRREQVPRYFDIEDPVLE
jgi:hypothetical protein